jgi:hypothetical protein
MPVKYIKGARVKWPEWAEPDDPQISALMNQAVNEANAMILTEMGSEPNMPTDPATGQGMPTRTLKRDKPGRYSINISGGKQYIDIYAQELAEEAAGVDPALEQQMIRIPCIYHYFWDENDVGLDNFKGYYITKGKYFADPTYWYPYDEDCPEYPDSYPVIRLLFMWKSNLLKSKKGLVGIPPGIEYVPEGLGQMRPYTIHNPMPLISARAGEAIFDHDFTSNSYYNPPTWSHPDYTPPWAGSDCVSGGCAHLGSCVSAPCPQGPSTGAKIMVCDGYDIISCIDWDPIGGGEHVHRDSLYCAANCACGTGYSPACSGGHWEYYKDGCWMCLFCTGGWSAWHDGGGCGCGDSGGCGGSSYSTSQGGSATDWIDMKNLDGDVLRRVVELSSTWVRGNTRSAPNNCSPGGCTTTGFSISNGHSPFPIFYGGAVNIERYQTGSVDWEAYSKWALMYEVVTEVWSESGSTPGASGHGCCEEPEPGPPPPQKIGTKDLFIVFDDQLTGGVGLEVQLESGWGAFDVEFECTTLSIYDCLGEAFYLIAYKVISCSAGTKFRYGIYYKGELTQTEYYDATIRCWGDECPGCDAHELAGGSDAAEGYAYGYVGACFRDLYNWHRFTLDPGGAFPVNPKVRHLPTE